MPPEGLWYVWLILAGRGWGKTRTGAEWVRRQVKNGFKLVNVIGATADDARDIMIEGESGILACCPDGERPWYRKSQRKLDWPNGATSLIFTADEPERLRGKQHEKLWADELASWRYLEAWDQAMFGLRLGTNPQVCITTTPRPTALVRRLLKEDGCAVTRGTTYDNRANLAPQFFASIIRKYEGTRLGRQELHAEVLDDNPAALWSNAMIEDHRVSVVPVLLNRIVVGVDPSASEDGAEAGIVVAGRGANGHGYVLADNTLRGRPEAWGRRAVESLRIWEGDRIIAEQNNGGLMVESTIKAVDRTAPVKLVTASRGKLTRAEPISALYEQGLIHHVGTFPHLEDQMTMYDEFTCKVSPDRMDALVWALTELFSRGTADIGDAEFGMELLTAREFPH